LLALIQRNSAITTLELAASLELSRAGVQKVLRSLKISGRLRRVSPPALTLFPRLVGVGDRAALAAMPIMPVEQSGSDIMLYALRMADEQARAMAANHPKRLRVTLQLLDEVAAAIYDMSRPRKFASQSP